MVILYVVLSLALVYVALSLAATWLVQNFPRNAVDDQPDWGTVLDARIPAVDGGTLEVWRIEPEKPSRGVVVIAHGWGRNRGRMLHRARIFGQLGFTTVVHSARDHGASSRCRNMNAVRFAEDIEAVLAWVREPVMLYGHSAGSAGAALVASRHPATVQVLFLEASYAYTREALLSLYHWVHPLFGLFFARAILFWMERFYRPGIDSVSPARLAPKLVMPVMLIHGEADRRFPVAFAHRLKASFAHPRVELYVAPGANHSDSSRTSGYRPAIEGFLARHAPQAAVDGRNGDP